LKNQAIRKPKKMKTKAARLKKAIAAIEQIAESDVRDAAPRSYPQGYTLGWCYHKMKEYYIRFALIALCLLAGLVVSESALWNLMRPLIQADTDNNRMLDNGWGAGAFLLLILTGIVIFLADKFICPGDKVRNLVFGVNDVKRRYRKLGKEFLLKFGEWIPDRTSVGGSSAVDLRHDAKGAIEELLVEQAREVQRLEDLGSFWRGRAREKFVALHKKGIALKIDINPKYEYYFKKGPTEVVFHGVRI